MKTLCHLIAFGICGLALASGIFSVRARLAERDAASANAVVCLPEDDPLTVWMEERRKKLLERVLAKHEVVRQLELLHKRASWCAGRSRAG